MDAKVLRAAVSAAIRVTVSTTLIGCGGNVSTDAGRATSSPAVKDTPTSTGEAAAKPTEPTGSPSPYPEPTPTGGSGPATETPTAGMTATSAGSEAGGMASIAGAGGDDASAGAPADVCGAAAHACLTQLEQTTMEPPSAATKACCDVVIATLEQPELDAICFDSVNTRFLSGGARHECCADQSTWVHRACTPWGPPVPPELTRAALQKWSLAA
jgi:hypothetical protein